MAGEGRELPKRELLSSSAAAVGAARLFAALQSSSCGGRLEALDLSENMLGLPTVSAQTEAMVSGIEKVG